MPQMRLPSWKSLLLFENDNYLIINKPAGLASLDERDRTLPSVKSLAEEKHSDVHLCHRLDKETSGVITIAKNAEAYRNLSIQFEKREVQKVYHAVAEGLHEFEDRLIDIPLTISARNRVRPDKLEGKASQTYVTTLEKYQKHSLLECKPITGRTHQIRVHLAYVKAPIVADEVYGGSLLYLSEIKKKFNLRQQTEEQPLIQRVALHAQKITFNDVSGEEISAEADYPKDVRALVNQLQKNI